MRGNNVISDRSANILIGVVTAVWAGNILAGMFQIQDYQPSESINGIFMAIVGGAFALRAKTKSDDDDDEKPARKKPAKK